jgi:branched-subunit amino acid aminotransferase/4-amino-4-deoxychorismate lyase
MIDLNGSIISEDTLPFSPLDASAYYGFSVYETFYVKDSKVAFFEEHYNRLKNSCEYFQFPTPLLHELKQRIKNLISKTSVEHGRLRLIVSPGKFSEVISPKSITSVIKIEQITSTPNDIKLLITSVRKPEPSIFPPFVKISSNIVSLLSYREAKLGGYDEGIMLTTKDHVSEGSYCNLFWTRNNELFTPSLDSSILEGVTRNKIIEVCNTLNIKINENKYLIKDLEACDNLYISSSTRGLLFVSKLNNRIFREDTFNKSNEIKNLYEKLQNESLEKW